MVDSVVGLVVVVLDATVLVDVVCSVVDVTKVKLPLV